MGAVRVLQGLAPKDRLQFVYADLGDPKAIDTLFQNNAIDTVIHFAAVAYVGESMAEPLRYTISASNSASSSATVFTSFAPPFAPHFRLIFAPFAPHLRLIFASFAPPLCLICV